MVDFKRIWEEENWEDPEVWERARLRPRRLRRHLQPRTVVRVRFRPPWWIRLWRRLFPTRAAYSVVQHQSSTGAVLTNSVGATTSLTWSSTPTNGNLLVVAFTFRGNITSATGSGFTKGPTITNGTGCQTEIWYKVAASESTAGPVISISASTLYELQQAEITGFTGTPTLDVSGTAVGTAVATLATAVSAVTTAASEFVFGCCGNAEGNTAGITWSASTAGGGATFGADIDTVNPAKNGEGLRDAWATSGASGTSPSVTFNLSAATGTKLAACIATFKGVVTAVNPYKHSAGYLVSGGSKRLRRRASSLYYSQTSMTTVLTQDIPQVQPAAAYFQTGTHRPARRRVGFWHTIAQAVNTSWTAVAAPGLPAGEALIIAGSQRWRRRARAGLLASSQTNALLVSDGQITVSGQAGWRSAAPSPARPNPPNLLLFLLVTVVAAPFKHAAGYLVMVYKAGRRVSRRMGYWPIWVQQSTPLLTSALPQTKPGLVMVQWQRRRARRRIGVWDTIAQAVNTVWTAASAPAAPPGESLLVSGTGRLRRRARSAYTTVSQSNALLVSDSQISIPGQAFSRVLTTTPARPNSPNTLLIILTVILIPFKHSAGVLIQVYKWGRRISRRMAYWPIWVQQSRPLLTSDIPETKPALVMVQWSRRRPRRRIGVGHGLGNQVNTVYSVAAAPLTPQSEALVTASAKRLRRRATSSVTVYQNGTTILQ
jgi:hypothetical protein